jgi:large subunit ribosomal protein L10
MGRQFIFMALAKSKKVELVDKYADAVKNSDSAVYVSYKGLPVSKQDTFRKKLFANNLHYTVVKKSLWERAVTAAAVKGEAPVIADELAIVWGKDLLSPAREAFEFSKENKGVFTILGGIWEGEFKDAKAMMAIATIPPREVLLSQLAYLLKSPMQRLAIGINEVAKTKN